MGKTVNEEISEIERQNRAFWSRMLRERFDRHVTLEVDWDTFEKDSVEYGWLLYPLNIQRAGIERLLYAITGLMDKDDKFKTAAIDSIDSIHITSAASIKTVKLLFHKGCIDYRCFAGDWNGYFGIEQMQQYLKSRVPNKSAVRRGVERWLSNLAAERERRRDSAQGASTAHLSESEVIEHIEDEPEPIDEASLPPREPAAAPTIPQYDVALRAVLESVYQDFLQALASCDLESLLNLVETTKTDEETLKSEMEKDGFASFAKWLLTTYPTMEQGSFISLKTKDEDLAGYYVSWLPPYTREYLNLTLIKFLKIGGQWKIVFRLTEMASAPFQVRNDEEPLAKALEVLATNPLMILERPDFTDASETPRAVHKLSKGKKRLKEELEKVLDAVQTSLQEQDVEAFLSAVVVSEKDEKTLRKKAKRLLKEILHYSPDQKQAVFVKLKTIGNATSGYYFVAPYPKNPSFKFVYLTPFVRRGGRWQMVFSLEHAPAMNLSVAKSGGDLVSRAEEVIAEIPMLHLDFVMTTLLEDAVRDNSS